MTFRFVFVALLLLLLLSGGANVRAQKLILFEDGDYSGYKNRRGEIVIPARFRIAGDFAKNDLAPVLDETGWCYINKKGAVVIRSPFIFDNGADYFKEGLVRIVSSQDKFGFADASGKTVIEPQFDYAQSFSEGVAAVCIECRKEKADAEHSYMTGGRWGYVNRLGRIIVPIEYQGVEHFFENGTGRVLINDKWKRVDRRGRFLD